MTVSAFLSTFFSRTLRHTSCPLLISGLHISCYRVKAIKIVISVRKVMASLKASVNFITKLLLHELITLGRKKKNLSAPSTLTFLINLLKINCRHISAKAISRQYCSNRLVIRAGRVCSNLLPTILLSVSLGAEYITDTTQIHLLIAPQWRFDFFSPPVFFFFVLSNYQPLLDSHMKSDSAFTEGQLKPSDFSLERAAGSGIK